MQSPRVMPFTHKSRFGLKSGAMVAVWILVVTILIMMVRAASDFEQFSATSSRSEISADLS